MAGKTAIKSQPMRNECDSFRCLFAGLIGLATRSGDQMSSHLIPRRALMIPTRNPLMEAVATTVGQWSMM